jgi:hypothetical protein
MIELSPCSVEPDFSVAMSSSISERRVFRSAGIKASGSKEMKMSDENRLLFLRIALIIIGLMFIFGIYTLSIVWPSGWTWGPGHSHYAAERGHLIGDVPALFLVAIILAVLMPRAEQV